MRYELIFRFTIVSLLRDFLKLSFSLQTIAFTAHMIWKGKIKMRKVFIALHFRAFMTEWLTIIQGHAEKFWARRKKIKQLKKIYILKIEKCYQLLSKDLGPSRALKKKTQEWRNTPSPPRAFAYYDIQKNSQWVRSVGICKYKQALLKTQLQ